MQPPTPRRTARWIGAGVTLVLAVLVVRALITNPRYEWSTAFAWFGSEQLFHGLVNTLLLTAVAMTLGVLLGIVVALGRISGNPLFNTVSWGYIWLFRGVPVFVQLLFWGYIAALYPRIAVNVPFLGSVYAVDSNAVFTPFVAAILGLGLNQAAYMAEIIRAGLLSVDSGQTEAASALGMKPRLIFARVVMPQAMRVIVPPTGNETISMLKTTSLVSVLAFPDLLYSTQLIYSANYKTIPLLIAASAWYLVMTSVLSIAQYFIERRFNRGQAPSRPMAIANGYRVLTLRLGRRAGTRKMGADSDA